MISGLVFLGTGMILGSQITRFVCWIKGEEVEPASPMAWIGLVVALYGLAL